MRLLVDLQAAQGPSATRGIGRYAVALTEALIDTLPADVELHLLLSSSFPAEAVELRRRFCPLVGDASVHTIEAPAGTGMLHRREWRRRAGEVIYRTVVDRIAPDLLLLASVFEGAADDVIVPDPQHIDVPVVAVLYDLIPMIFPERYLGDRALASWYHDRIERIERCDHLLAISECTATDASRLLGVGDVVTTILGAVTLDEASAPAGDVLERLGINGQFLLYVGGIDARKNVEGLIEAYASLPAATRDRARLVIVCSITADDRDRLDDLGRRAGLRPGDLVLTGFVSDADLGSLYQLAVACVFPSLYEGLGLPVLEAIEHGCPAVVSDAGSLPELVLDQSARFDPNDRASIAAVVEHVIVDEAWRLELLEHQRAHAATFTWERTARTAWDALLASVERPVRTVPASAGPRRVAVVSPFPPTPSGISDFSEPLVEALASRYLIERVDASPHDGHRAEGVRDAAWLRRHGAELDAIVYHFGNSFFHWEMFELLRTFPGVVVFHDFYLSGLLSAAEGVGLAPDSWPLAVHRSHGLAAVRAMAELEQPYDLAWTHPVSLEPMVGADALVFQSEFSRGLAARWFGIGSETAAMIPLAKRVEEVIDVERARARELLGIGVDEFVVCCFGSIASTKLNFELLDAFSGSDLAADPSCRLLYVGDDTGDVGDELARRIRSSDQRRVTITGRVGPVDYRRHLAACDVAVQLRTHTRGESSGAILDVMAAGIPLIVNRHGSAAELPDDAVFAVPDEFTGEELTRSLEQVWRDRDDRAQRARTALDHVRRVHDPDRIAAQHAEVIDATFSCSWNRRSLQRALAALPGRPTDSDRVAVAGALAATFPPPNRPRQVLVDVTGLVEPSSCRRAPSLVWALASNVLFLEAPGWRVEPVRADDDGFRYARSFAASTVGPDVDLGRDEPVEMFDGDVFLGLDASAEWLTGHLPELLKYRARGARFGFVAGDLVELEFPDAGTDRPVAIAATSGLGPLFAVGTAIEQGLRAWCGAERPQVTADIRVIAPGGERRDARPGGTIPRNAPTVLGSMRDRPTFLVVAPLDVPEGHAQVIAGFEELWEAGDDVGLVVAGPQRSGPSGVTRLLREHGELGSRLHFLEGWIDEPLLDALVQRAAAVIDSSWATAVAVPLIDARRHGRRVIARDIAALDEFVDDDAVRFSGGSPASVADAVRRVLGADRHLPPSHGVLPSWRDAVSTILSGLGAADLVTRGSS